ncbi:hypothetical protein QCD71_16645 [Sphingomonas sp. PsM26]|nr:hypothetical protein [Sphingomonas sp. PsM26]
MITINIDDPERGEPKVFPDEATAIVWLQDEIIRWENALSSPARDVNGPCATPLRRWRDIKESIDQARRRRDSLAEEQDYIEQDSANRTVLLESVYGYSLIFVLRSVGSVAADFAAINAGLADGQMDWTNDDAFRGAILFDSRRQFYIDIEDRHIEKSRLIRRTTAEKQTEHIMQSITQLDGMVSSLATVTNQQREQIDVELKTYKAEAIEGWKELSGQAQLMEFATKSALSAAESEFEAAITKAKTSVDNWTLAHNEARQLEKPADLWAERARAHLKIR